MDEKETRISQLTEKTGFILDGVKELPEMKAVLYQMHFRKNGAKLMWLSRREENKTFTITFKTLPPDDTGVFHIYRSGIRTFSSLWFRKIPGQQALRGDAKEFAPDIYECIYISGQDHVSGMQQE